MPMKRIINIGSLNLDKIYQLPHTPLPGETLTASSNRIGLGGKRQRAGHIEAWRRRRGSWRSG